MTSGKMVVDSHTNSPGDAIAPATGLGSLDQAALQPRSRDLDHCSLVHCMAGRTILTIRHS
jgi:hypothetical protein